MAPPKRWDKIPATVDVRALTKPIAVYTGEKTVRGKTVTYYMVRSFGLRLTPDGGVVWTVRRDREPLTKHLSERQLNRSAYRQVPRLGQFDYPSGDQPVSDWEWLQIVGPGEVDWRPTETIPEDYYAL